MEDLCAFFGRCLACQGEIARGGQIADASLVSVPKNRGSRGENGSITASDTPEGWPPAMLQMNDHPARFTRRATGGRHGLSLDSSVPQTVLGVCADQNFACKAR